MDQGPFGWHRESWKQSLCSLFRLSNIEQDSSLIRPAIAGSSVLVNMLDTNTEMEGDVLKTESGNSRKFLFFFALPTVVTDVCISKQG